MASSNEIGAAAERAELTKLRSEGYGVYVFQTTQGHGVDLIGLKQNFIEVIEVKANSSGLSKYQRFGGKEFLIDRLTAAQNGHHLNRPGAGWMGNGRYYAPGNRPAIEKPLATIANEVIKELNKRGYPDLTQSEVDDMFERRSKSLPLAVQNKRKPLVTFRFKLVKYRVDQVTLRVSDRQETYWHNITQ